MLTVDRQVDGATHRDVACHIIARVVRDIFLEHARTSRRDARKRDASRVDRLERRELIAVERAIGVGREGIGDIHIALLHSGKRGVLVHKYNDDPLHDGRLAVIVGVRLKDHLLSLIPLLENIGAGPNGIVPVIIAIRCLGNNAEHRQGIEQGVVRLRKMQFHNRVAHRDGPLHHGKVRLRAGALNHTVDGEGNVGGGQRVAVRKDRIVADGEGPHQAV